MNEFDYIFHFNEDTLRLFKALTELHDSVNSFHLEPNQEYADQMVDRIRIFETSAEKFKASIGRIVRKVTIEEDDVIAHKGENGIEL